MRGVKICLSYVLAAIFHSISGEDLNDSGLESTNETYSNSSTTKSKLYQEYLSRYRINSTNHEILLKNQTVKIKSTIVSETTTTNLNLLRFGTKQKSRTPEILRVVDEVWNTTMLSDYEDTLKTLPRNTFINELNIKIGNANLSYLEETMLDQINLLAETQIETTILPNTSQSNVIKNKLPKDQNNEGLRRQYPQYSGIQQYPGAPRQYPSAQQMYPGVPKYNPSIYNSHAAAPKQYPGVPPRQIKPPTDPEIEKLLNEYRAIVHKYGPDTPGKGHDYDEPHYQNSLNVTRFNVPGQFYPTPRAWYGNTGPWEINPFTKAVLKQGPPGVGSYFQGAATTEEDQVEIMGPPVTTPGPTIPVAEGAAAGATQAPSTLIPTTVVGDDKRGEAAGAATRFTTRMTTTRRKRRTTPKRVSFEEDCDYIAYYCLKAYDTGMVCGRTLYFHYVTFKNYCMLDYVNCMERYDIWQIAYMGECFKLKLLTEYLHYPYNDDYFLDAYYIVEDM